MTRLPAIILSLKVGEPFDNAGLSLKAAFAAAAAVDTHIEDLLTALLAEPYRPDAFR